MSQLSDRAAVIPGRSLTRSKAIFNQWAKSAHGAEIVTVDRVRLLDTLCALGAASLGYTSKSGVMSLPSEMEICAAERMLEVVAPWASHARFTKTGSEAVSAAVDIAREATGRQVVLVADNSYHGWHGWFRRRGQAGTEGQWTSSYRYGDMDMLPWPEIAAVIVEPARWEVTPPGYLEYLKQFAHGIGALFIIDEMIYGGRWAIGGACEFHGVVPDMACYGKALGGTQAVACVVGNQALAEHGEIVSGTYSGDTVGLYAVLDTLEVYTTQPVIETLWARGTQLQDGLKQIIPADLGVCEGQPVHQRIRFFNEAHGPAFAKGMLERGIAWHPAVCNIMFAHTSAHMDQVIEAASDIVKELR